MNSTTRGHCHTLHTQRYLPACVTHTKPSFGSRLSATSSEGKPRLAGLSSIHCQCYRGPRHAVQCSITAAVAQHASSRKHEHASASTSGNAEAQLESLEVLEWPAVCRQVACFCSTVMATQRVVLGQLPIGRSQAESEKLLRQTAEAMEASLSLKGVFDLRPALDAVREGLCLSARQLEGIASTLEVVFAAKEAACSQVQDRQQQQGEGEGLGFEDQHGQGQGLRFPELAALCHGIEDDDRDILVTIQNCIKRGYITDESSERLKSVRQRRSANKEELRALMDDQAKQAFAKGASDSRSVSLMRGRYCIGIKAGRQGDLPKGSVKVGQSQSGATHYFEPAPAIKLNNAETLLEEEERKEEQQVLVLLTQMVGGRLPQLAALLAAAADLDMAAARAGHARWLQGIRPHFISWEDFRQQQQGQGQQGQGQQGQGQQGQQQGEGRQGSTSPFHVPAALHPLLLEPALPPLPEPPSIDDNRFEQGFVETPGWEVRRSLVATAGAASSSSSSGGSSSGSDSSSSQPRGPPRPLDLRIPGAVAVVAITGPNTGGKTVTLKTAGLAALMAKAGLYLASEQQGREGTGDQQARMLWYDQVLADIGDAQSLQQNLSTFSGHIRRINAILAAATDRSLVLLDEVGSGTDPLEGAALARAVLDRLAGQTGLTLATTHHAELKTVADEDARYVNVSMEFDVQSLAPTYRLCWGSAGASNALDIAQALGFDSAVLREARIVAREVVARERNRASHMEAVAKSLKQQVEEAQADLAGLARKRQAMEQQALGLSQELGELHSLRDKIDKSPKLITKEVKQYAAELQEAVDALGQGKMSSEEVAQRFSKLEAIIPDLVAQHKGVKQQADLSPGDTVWVNKLQGEAIVEEVSGQYVYVRTPDMALAAFGFKSQKARSRTRYLKEEVQLSRRAGEEAAEGLPPELWASKGGKQAARPGVTLLDNDDAVEAVEALLDA